MLDFIFFAVLVFLLLVTFPLPPLHLLLWIALALFVYHYYIHHRQNISGDPPPNYPNQP